MPANIGGKHEKKKVDGVREASGREKLKKKSKEGNFQVHSNNREKEGGHTKRQKN